MASFFKNNATWLLLAGFVLFCVIWFAAQPTPIEEAAPEWSDISSLAPAASDAPNLHNVAPEVHAKIESLRNRVAVAPDDTAHVFLLARTLHDAHQLADAATQYAAYLDVRPQNRQAWLDLAQCYGQLSEWTKALTAVQSLLTHYPGDEAGRYNEGAIYANMGASVKAQDIWHDLVMNGVDNEVKELARASLQRLMGISP